MNTASDLPERCTAELLRRHLKIGDVLTHTRCAGTIEEHAFTGWSGSWLCGRATTDTRRISGARRLADDIGPGSVTHVNRVHFTYLDLMAAIADEQSTRVNSIEQGTAPLHTASSPADAAAEVPGPSGADVSSLTAPADGASRPPAAFSDG